MLISELWFWIPVWGVASLTAIALAIFLVTRSEKDEEDE